MDLLRFTKITEDLDFRRYVYTEESAERRERLATEIPIELVEKVCVFGTLDKCIDRLGKYVDAELRHVQLLPLGSPEFILGHTLRLCAEKILPYFKTVG